MWAETMKQSSTLDSNGYPLVVERWLLEQPARAVVQIAHGAAEHLGRYDRLARILARHGYQVLGADHRGHGANAKPGKLGDLGPDGFPGVVEDMRRVTEAARNDFPSLPVILLAHSFGSFAAQAYLMQHAHLIDGLVLSGTAAIDLLLSAAPPGSDLMSANAPFEPARTPFDWLSRDEQEVDAYIADPLCGFDLSLTSLATMAETVTRLMERCDLSGAAAKDPPIYIISGEHDPIVGPEQCFARALAERYLVAGVRDVQHRFYPGGRHEMFNELNRNEVVGDLLNWLNVHF